jgi:hypothetical protein
MCTVADSLDLGHTNIERGRAMSKFNRSVAATGPVRSGGVMTTTFEGGPAWSRDARSDLFLLAVTNLVGEDTFYEAAGTRDDRYRALVHAVAVEDVDWLGRFIPWLRSEANMRSAAVVAAAEAVKARLEAGLSGGNRQLVNAACQRADEPGELLAYWTARYGRAVPKPVKRGLADAVVRLYNERSLLKYDADGAGFRFADVIDLVHPFTADPAQGALFAHALDRRHARDKPIAAALPVLRARAELAAIPVAERRAVLADPERLAAAGMTWEVLAGWLQGPMDAAAWSAVIPSMGYMACIRNLRNFDEAGVSDEVADTLARRLSNPVQVARSRQFPYRFLSAYRAAPSLRWGYALEKALAAATASIPDLPGRTLVLVDTSGSMQTPVSRNSRIRHVDVGALIGVALAFRGCAVDLVGFADGTFRHRVTGHGSMLRDIDGFTARIGEVGHGTRMIDALHATYAGHDRVIVVSDMQTFPSGRGAVDGAVPKRVPLFGINTTGYAPAAIDTTTPNRYEVGGFSDKAFTMFALLSSGRTGWPF